MEIYPPDLYYFTRQPITFATPKRAKHRIEKYAYLVTEYEPELLLYPELKVEPLAEIYDLIRDVGVIDQVFLKEQLTGHWGIIKSGLLCLLKPRIAWLEVLEAFDRDRFVSSMSYPENIWLHDCAVSIIRGEQWPPAYAEFESSFRAIQKTFEKIRVPNTPLRRKLTNDENQQLEGFRLKILSIYQKHGLEASRAEAQASPYFRWIQTYREWVRTGSFGIELYQKKLPSGEAL